jgi:predicted nucleotide-binding protein
VVKKRSVPTPEQAPLLLTVSPEVAAAKIDDRIRHGEEIKLRRIANEVDFEEARSVYKMWTDYNAELLKRLFTSGEIAEEYKRWVGGGVWVVREIYLQEKISDLHKDVETKIQRLKSIKARLELIPMAAGVASAAAGRDQPLTSKRVFIVHGHDEAAREGVARFLEKLDLEPIILHEQPSGGRTVIEKLEHHADVAFAVVLLTPDDVGAAAGDRDDLSPRARQNVVLELGYFAGRLGRSRVCALHKGSLELPSDIIGVVYVPLDSGGSWRLLLAKELREAGFDIDLNAAI